MSRYASKLGRLGAIASTKVAGEAAWSMATVAGMVENYQERLFKGGAGGRAAFLEIEDMYGRVKAKVRGDRIDTYAHVLTSGEPVLLSGKVSYPITDEPEEEPEPTLLVDSVELLADAALKNTRAVCIRLSARRTARRTSRRSVTSCRRAQDRARWSSCSSSKARRRCSISTAPVSPRRMRSWAASSACSAAP